MKKIILPFLVSLLAFFVWGMQVQTQAQPMKDWHSTGDRPQAPMPAYSNGCKN